MAGRPGWPRSWGTPRSYSSSCLAHLIRDAQYAVDHGDTIFAPDFKALLKDACEVGRRRPDLADATIAAHRRRLERQLEQLLARKPTDAEGRKLRDAVYVDCSATSCSCSCASRRRADQQRKRAGTEAVGDLSQSDEWIPLRVGREATYAALCSIVETGRRNSRNALTAIRDALALPATQAAGPRPAHTG